MLASRPWGASRVARVCLVVTLACAFGLIALTAACGSSHSKPGFTGFWQAAGGHSGVRIDKLGQDYFLTIVNSDGSMGIPMRATLSNGDLYSGPGTEASPGPGPEPWYLVTGDPGSGSLTLTLSVFAGATQTFPLERSTSTIAASPNPLVSPPGYSPPPTSQALVNGSFSSEKDKQVAENLYAIQIAVEKYIAAQHAVPEASDVTLVGAVSNYLRPWPANPYTTAGGPMIVGKQPGKYTYAASGKTYTLTAYLGSGSTFVISGPPH
jgi:hypothetical protein